MHTLSGIHNYKYLSNSKEYKYVGEYYCTKTRKNIFISRLPKSPAKYFDTPKECAIFVDKLLLNRGKNPINVLKRVV